MNSPTEIIRTRHIHLASIAGALMMWLGIALSMTVAGIVIGVPVAFVGFGLLTTPHPH